MREGKIVLTLLVAGASAALGSLNASAQVIVDPTGPLCVAEGSSSSTYTATVTANYSYDFLLKVYQNGVLRHNTTTHVTNSGPTSSFSKVVSHYQWGLAEGDLLEYKGRATLTEGPYSGSFDEKTLTRDCQLPGGCRNTLPVWTPDDPVYAMREENV